MRQFCYKISLPKIFLLIAIALSTVLILGTIKIISRLPQITPKITPTSTPLQVSKIEISADAKSILNGETKAVIFTIADTQKYLKDSGYAYNPDTFQDTNAKYAGDCFVDAVLSNNKDRIVFSTGCLPGDLPQNWIGIYSFPHPACSNGTCLHIAVKPTIRFLVGGSGKNFVWSFDDKTISYEADLGLSGMTETRTIDSGTGKVLERKLITDDKILPQFKDYPVTEKFQASSTPPDLNSHPKAREFRGVLREGVKDGPNFAGHYTIVEWGCGTRCLVHAIIDAKTGKVYFLDEDSEEGFSLDFRVDSNLLIVNSPKGIQEMLEWIQKMSDVECPAECRQYQIEQAYKLPSKYYKWENDKLELIFSTK